MNNTFSIFEVGILLVAIGPIPCFESSLVYAKKATSCERSWEDWKDGAPRDPKTDSRFL